MSQVYPITPQTDNYNINKKLNQINSALDTLPWLDHTFNDTATVETEEGDIIPVIYSVNNDYENMSPNDNWKGHSFFRVNDPIEPIRDEDSIRTVLYQANVDLFIFFDYTRIDNGSRNYHFNQIIISDILKKIDYLIQLQEIYQRWDDVIDNYDFDQKYGIHPRGAFRFNFDVIFSIDCNIPTV